MTTLAKDGSSSNGVYRIGDSGDVAGYVGSLFGTAPVVWDSANNPIYVAAGREGQATAVNASRVAVGFVDRFDSKGFVWSESTGLQLLPLLPGLERSYPSAINNSNVIVGSGGMNTGGTENRAFLWTASNGIQDLGAGTARDINNLNVVVGQQSNYAFVWDAVNGLRDLNSLGDFVGWYLSDGAAINDQGQILGRGQYQSLPAAFLMTPVPEPSSAASLAAGLVFGFWYVWQRELQRGLQQGAVAKMRT
jgi:hypothetical protein